MGVGHAELCCIERGIDIFWGIYGCIERGLGIFWGVGHAELRCIDRGIDGFTVLVFGGFTALVGQPHAPGGRSV